MYILRMKLKSSIKSLRGGGTVAEKTKLEEQRRKLQIRVTSFQNAAAAFYTLSPTSEGTEGSNDESGDLGDPFADPDDDDEEGDGE